MGVDTKAILRKGVTIEQIKEALELRYQDVEIEADREYCIRVFFIDGEDKRTLWIFDSITCLADYNIDGILCSLGCWGNSVEIMRYLCETFGGYLDENDCDDEDFYPINFHLFEQSTEYTEKDLLVNEIISELGYDNLKKALSLFERYKNVKL